MWTRVKYLPSHTHSCSAELLGTPCPRHALSPFTSSLCKWHHAPTPTLCPFIAHSPILNFEGVMVPLFQKAWPTIPRVAVFIDSFSRRETSHPCSDLWSGRHLFSTGIMDRNARCLMSGRHLLIKGRGCWQGLLWMSVFYWFRRVLGAENTNIWVWAISHQKQNA